MTKHRSKTIATCLCLLALNAFSPSCGGSSESTGTDSNTHWLEECSQDSDCGSLSCVCGVCHRTCDAAASCSDLGANASCAAPAHCTETETRQTCAVQCGIDSECRFLGAAGACRGGQCRVDGKIPVSGPCVPMDAVENGDDCETVAGYAWHGKACAPILCGCVGGDCGRLYASMDACDRAHAACYAEHGVTRECSRHSDCLLASRYCCERCDVTAADAVLGVRADAVPFSETGLCLGDPGAGCPPCVAIPNLALHAACVDGQCSVLDVGDGADCSADADCRVRTKDCCECNSDTSPAGLMAVNADFSCTPDSDSGCAECQVNYPAEITSRCEDSGKCTLDSSGGLD